MKKLKVFPFSTGCSSQASIAVCKSKTCDPCRKPTSDSSSTHQSVTSKHVVGEECSSKGRTKNSFAWLPLSKPNISSGIQRLIRVTVKSFSQLSVYKEIEEVTAEMEIGFPTDVKHVTHIGLDDTSTTNHVKVWEDFSCPPDHIFAFPSISVRQFELAMAAQTQNAAFIV